LVFGPDGNLYVSSTATNQVLRFNGTTGAFVDVFASGGGLTGPYGLAFGPDGNLYVSSVYTNQVLRYNGTTGAFVDIFASGGGLNFPTFLTFTPAAPIPEPATSVVLVTALAGLALANKLRAARMHRYGQHRN
jgi:DNA-binding beta-propeller fold protein YncE